MKPKICIIFEQNGIMKENRQKYITDFFYDKNIHPEWTHVFIQHYRQDLINIFTNVATNQKEFENAFKDKKVDFSLECCKKYYGFLCSWLENNQI